MTCALPLAVSTRDSLYKHLRVSLSLLDESAHEAVREVALAWATKVLEFLDDERSMTDALAATRRCIHRGDEVGACKLLSAVAARLPPNGCAIQRLGDQACAKGLLRVVDTAAGVLRSREMPLPAAWSRALVDDPCRERSVVGRGESRDPTAADARVSGAPASLDRSPEEAILSRILRDPEAFDVLRDLVEPEHLPTSGQRLVLRACDALRSEGRAIDIVQVARWLREHGLLEEAGGVTLLARLLDDLSDGGDSDDAFVSRLVDRERTGAYPIKSVLHDTFDRIAKANGRVGMVTGIPTGFDEYDRLTGGLHDGEVTVLAGPPGTGTTSLALAIALRVASPTEIQRGSGDRALEPGCGVIVFSLATPRRQLVNRILCSEARVELGTPSAEMLTKRDWERLTEAAGRLAGLSIWVKDDPRLGHDAIRNVGARLKAEFETFATTGERMRRIGLIVIDGWHHVRRRRKLRRRLKDIARELMVPIIATMEAQPGPRGPDGERLDASDVHLSEHDADNLCLLNRARDCVPDRDSQGADVCIAWQSSGPAGVVHLRWNAGTPRLDDLARGEGHARPG